MHANEAGSSPPIASSAPRASGKKPKPKTTSRGSLGVDKIIEQAIKDGAELVPVREIFKRSKMKVGRE